MARHDPGLVLLDLARTPALGGDTCLALAAVRAEPAFVGPLASNPTLSRVLNSVTLEDAVPMPRGITRINKWCINPFMLRLAGIRPMVDLQHVGRRTGTVRHAPLMVFRRGDVVTIALTYGAGVQWLANIRHAGQCRMRMGREVLRLGAPRMLNPAEGLARIPHPQRALLRWPIRCRDYVELPVLDRSPRRADQE